MKKTKMIPFKRMLGLFIFVIITYLCSLTAVKAKSAQDVLCNSDTQYVRYGLEISENGSQYTISINPESDFPEKLEKLQKTVFTITSINDKPASGKVSYGSPYRFNDTSDTGAIVVELETNGSDNQDPDCQGTIHLTAWFSDACPSGGCEPVSGTTDYSFDFGGLPENINQFNACVKGCEGSHGKGSDNYYECVSDCAVSSGLTTSAVNCDKGIDYKTAYSEDSFEYKFCYAKEKAIAAGNDTDLGTALNFGDTKQELWCGVKFCTSEDELGCVPTDTSYTMEDERYYKNKDYFYAKNKQTKTAPVYTYNYAPGDVQTETGDACKIECEETVEAEYGPPVATKAGLCFEYKVKVTSRVSCKIIQPPGLPKYVTIDDSAGGGGKIKVSAPVCTPAPSCMDSGGGGSWSGLPEGGPNEEFDACVQTCDGGKYTDKCSKKCYKKVYGSISNATRTSLAFADAVAEKLVSASDPSVTSCIERTAEFGGSSMNDGTSTGKYKGCYYWDDGGSINWAGTIINSNGRNHYAPGRWYSFGDRHKNLSEYRVYADDAVKGFYRHDYGGGAHCDDICFWTGCNKGQYLNDGQAEHDAEENMKDYQKALEECLNAASCTETTADFSIFAEYDTVNYDGKAAGNYTKVYFPYTDGSDNPEKLTAGGRACNASQSLSENTTILQYGGCYATGQCKPYVWYMSEWTFPGSWINNKTAEVSFEPKDTGWQKADKKFCTPLNAADVNEKWWNYYYKKTLVDQEETSVERDGYKKECLKEEYTNSIENVTDVSKDDIERWNIQGSTKGFGYFGWNIDMNCFYAINSVPAASTDSDKETVSKDDSCKVDQTNYRMRSVDLEDLFPAQDGKTVASPSETGREQGFNWTDYAKPGGTDGVTSRTVTISNSSGGSGVAVGGSSGATGGSGGGSTPVTSYSVKASPYVIEPEKYIEQVQTLKNSVYEGEDYLDYYFYLTPSIMQKLKKEGKDFNDFKSDTHQDTIIYYQSDVIRNTNFDVVHYPNTSVLSCNNIRNYSSTTCES